MDGWIVGLHALQAFAMLGPSQPNLSIHQAAETTVAEALLVFGELAAGGIKFHRAGSSAKFKQRRRQLPQDSPALHAFCRFLRPESASQVSRKDSK
tara:strand:- start:232 stop:519 length:288 start_codon:yes stop_codon:yes gene_type:complete